MNFREDILEKLSIKRTSKYKKFKTHLIKVIVSGKAAGNWHQITQFSPGLCKVR
jgi:hypothetical protein